MARIAGMAKLYQRQLAQCLEKIAGSGCPHTHTTQSHREPAIFQRFWVDGAAGNGRPGVLFNQPASRWVDSGIKK